LRAKDAARSAIGDNGQDQDDTALMPYTTVQKKMVNSALPRINRIVVSAVSSKATTAAKDQLTALLRDATELDPWAALTVHPDFASYNIRKALACRQFRRFTGGVDVIQTCAIPSAGARVSAQATRCVRFVANVHQRVLVRPCKFRQASLNRKAAGGIHACRCARWPATGRCVSATPSSNAQPAAGPARNWTCRGLWGPVDPGPFLNHLRSRGQ
jgi:hypothetical protein